MKRTEAIMLLCTIVAECNKHTADGTNCQGCPFGYGPECLASNGDSGIPSDWLIEEVLTEELLKGKNT